MYRYSSAVSVPSYKVLYEEIAGHWALHSNKYYKFRLWIRLWKYILVPSTLDNCLLGQMFIVYDCSIHSLKGQFYRAFDVSRLQQWNGLPWMSYVLTHLLRFLPDVRHICLTSYSLVHNVYVHWFHWIRTVYGNKLSFSFWKGSLWVDSEWTLAESPTSKPQCLERKTVLFQS